jgi:hypothetical protein
MLGSDTIKRLVLLDNGLRITDLNVSLKCHIGIILTCITHLSTSPRIWSIHSLIDIIRLFSQLIFRLSLLRKLVHQLLLLFFQYFLNLEWIVFQIVIAQPSLVLDIYS